MIETHIHQFRSTLKGNHTLQFKNSRGLIDLKAAKLPVRSVETSRIIPHKCRAVARATTLCRVVLGRARQVTTQRDIDDDTLVLEMRTDVAIRAGEVRKCFAPGGWVGTARGDIGRDLGADPLPDANTSVTELHRVDLKGVVISKLVSMEA